MCARTVRPMRPVVMLGTGTPNVDPDRAGSGVALMAASAWLLVDCGRGVTQRVMQADLDLKRLSAVLLTHHHSDHISDRVTLPRRDHGRPATSTESTSKREVESVVVEMSYMRSYDCRMAVLNFRTDARSEKALAELMADGSTASDAIRRALVDAVRLRRREQMRAESRALASDDVDRAESRRVLAEVDELRAW
jgi:ribonuclease BN (tRNA processing enzyme)